MKSKSFSDVILMNIVTKNLNTKTKFTDSSLTLRMTRITEWLRVLQADYKPQSRKQQNTPFGVSTAKKQKRPHRGIAYAWLVESLIIS